MAIQLDSGQRWVESDHLFKGSPYIIQRDGQSWFPGGLCVGGHHITEEASQGGIGDWVQRIGSEARALCRHSQDTTQFNNIIQVDSDRAAVEGLGWVVCTHQVH